MPVHPISACHARAFWVPPWSPLARPALPRRLSLLGQPAPFSPAGRGSSRRAHPAATFIRSLPYIKEPQRRSKCSEVSLAQPKVLSEGDVLLSAAPGHTDGLSPPHQSHLLVTAPPAGRRTGTWLALQTLGIARHQDPAPAAHRGARVRSAPLPLAKALLGLLLLGTACACPRMEGDGSTWHGRGDHHSVGAEEGDSAWPLLGSTKLSHASCH